MELVEAMAAAGLLQQHQLTPLMLGAAKDDYAQVGGCQSPTVPHPGRFMHALTPVVNSLSVPVYQAD